MKKSKDIKQHIEFNLQLRKNPYSGLYVAFEGIDGAGKTVQVSHLEKYLIEKRHSVTVTSEPRREGPVGQLIHEILQGKVKVPPASLQYLYTAERVINHYTVIEPSLKNGVVVLSHRCLWSNVPYGMLDKNLTDFASNDKKVIDVAHGLMSLYHQFIVPDVTFYLRVSPETAMKRLNLMGGVHEIYEKREKLEKVMKGYEWEVKEFPGKFVVIDGEKTEDEVAKEIKAHLGKILE